MRELISKAVVLIPVALLFSGPQKASSKPETGLETPVYATAPAATADRASSLSGKVSAAEATFISDAIKDNLKEVGFGELARRKAVSAEVKAFGEQMIKDHSATADKLIALAMSKSIDPPKVMSSESNRHLQTLAMKSGKSFDDAYIADMVKDHQSDVSKFEKMAQQAQDPELQKLVTSTLPVLRAHLQHVQGLAGSSK